MALAEKMLGAEFGKKAVDHIPMCCFRRHLMEGVSQEAIALAGHWKLHKLIVLYDDNGISIDGRPRSPTRSTRSNASSPPAGRPS